MFDTLPDPSDRLASLTRIVARHLARIVEISSDILAGVVHVAVRRVAGSGDELAGRVRIASGCLLRRSGIPCCGGGQPTSHAKLYYLRTGRRCGD